jgi:hypothetical protein
LFEKCWRIDVTILAGCDSQKGVKRGLSDLVERLGGLEPTLGELGNLPVTFGKAIAVVLGILVCRRKKNER